MTNILSMQRVLLALGIIVFVGAAVVSATGAFFNDTETSTGNTFAAGDIDLQIDNESYVVDYNLPTPPVDPTGELAYSALTSWELTDLIAGTHKFFNFHDLKPGDLGEDTISIHVGSNDGYLCAAARVTENSDENCTEPESTDENRACVDETLEINGTNGDLASQLNFAFWRDDGDNVFESGEAPTEVPNPTSDGAVFLSGPLSGLGAAGQIALADTSGNAPFGTSVAGDSTVYIGKVWCFGALNPTPIAQDGLGLTGTFGARLNGPDTRGTGWSCAGAAINNIAQTDSVTGDMQFFAVQTRNNPGFLCSQGYTPTWPEIE